MVKHIKSVSKKFLRRTVFLLLAGVTFSCSSSDVEDALDLAEDPARKTLPYERLAVNAFTNDLRFGSIEQQFLEVRDTLKLNLVRVLVNWGDEVQPSPNSNINFSFTDSQLASLPPGMSALLVVTNAPSWMNNSINWVDGNPRKTFAQGFFRRVVRRYAGRANIVGYQVWNEPNNPSFGSNTTLDLLGSPQNYVELLSFAHPVVKELDPSKLVLNAATTAINQNFPQTINYNEGMRDAAIDRYIDRYAIHYYGKQFENVVRGSGVADFLNGLPKPIWITESGAQGVNNQLAYGEQVWPYLIDKVPSIERIFIYQFTEATPPDSTYGLRNLSGNLPVSDLYVKLRDRD